MDEYTRGYRDAQVHAQRDMDELQNHRRYRWRLQEWAERIWGTGGGMEEMPYAEMHNLVQECAFPGSILRQEEDDDDVDE